MNLTDCIMKKPTLVIAAFAALVLAGCATTQFKPSKLGQLNLGMDKGEVLRLLGKPTQAATAAFVDMPSGGLRKKEALRYDELRRDPRQTNHFVVVFLEGKVTEYGPEVGRLASEMEGVFTEYPKEASATDSDQNRDAADEITENKHIIHRYFDEWANRGDTAAADELIAADVVLRNPPAVINGLSAYKQGLAGFRQAFPDLRFTIEEPIAEGDKVVVHWTLRGTHSGEYQGRPPTGKAITVTGTSLFLLSDGKVQEITVNMDRLGMLEQLGWLSAPASQPGQDR